MVNMFYSTKIQPPCIFLSYNLILSVSCILSSNNLPVKNRFLLISFKIILPIFSFITFLLPEKIFLFIIVDSIFRTVTYECFVGYDSSNLPLNLVNPFFDIPTTILFCSSVSSR
ncbi:hypothetical protein TUBRATIS_14840 [Tubulinosema ratisbonensis]|uniref:Uncharacterized protein n=1 Tax=Tubulinosema ratisbonensis TaxID=291195 RepID=A0A437ALF9_9MICR|nr:hypothetical protein TUBRATIS_14840 [Tubulinosema ratisbonensis]